MSVTAVSNSPIQDYCHTDNNASPTYYEMISGLKPFTVIESVYQESCTHYRAKEKAECYMADSNGDAPMSVVMNSKEHGRSVERHKFNNGVWDSNLRVHRKSSWLWHQIYVLLQMWKCWWIKQGFAWLQKKTQWLFKGYDRSWNRDVILKYSSCTSDAVMKILLQKEVITNVELEKWEQRKWTETKCIKDTGKCVVWCAQKTVKGLTSISISYVLMLFIAFHLIKGSQRR